MLACRHTALTVPLTRLGPSLTMGSAGGLMALVFSILTPDWLLHVSDAPGGVVRTLRVQREGTPGLLTWAGPMSLLDGLESVLSERGARDPADLATQVAREAKARVPADVAFTALYAGWGTSPEGHAASFRWRITNFEAEEDDEVAVDGDWLVPSVGQASGRGAAQISYSVMVSTTEELPGRIRSGIERILRDLKKQSDPTALALRLVEWIGEIHADAPAVIALLRRDGSLEAGRLEGGALSGLSAAPTPGVRRLS